VTLRKVELDEKQILANLLEKYDYEFSQYTGADINKLGLFGYSYLDHYWTDEGQRWAYFIEVDGKLAGFVMVKKHFSAEGREIDFCMAEFFVVYKYRGTGVAKKAFFDTLKLHKGRWELYYTPKNITSARFWHKTINEYTDGKYEFIKAYPTITYDDGTPADLFIFES